ncbi:MAG TPA: response regulator transcription factor [Luteolibacter sp.]
MSAPLPAILMIDDDRGLTELVGDYLRPMGYAFEAIHDGAAGLQRALGEPWHAIILDVMMPGMDGFEVLKKLRAVRNTPVLMLTGRSDETDRIVGLEVGADDYLPKTFSMRELLARLRAVTRRSALAVAPADAQPALDQLVVGDLRITPETRRAVLGDQPLQLRPIEFDLLHALAKTKGRVRSRDWLLEQVRDREYEVFDRTIDMHISALRKKLGDDPKVPRFIRTYRSVGYMLIDPSAEN